MSLLAPMWLLLLLPWGGFVAWALIGRPRVESATAVFLWSRESPTHASTRSIRRPAAWVLLMLASILLAIVALAGPAWVGRGSLAIRIDDRPGLSAGNSNMPSRGSATSGELRRWAAEQGIDVVQSDSSHAVEAFVTDDPAIRSTATRIAVMPRTSVANAGVSRVVFANGQVMLSIVNRRETPIDRVTLTSDGAARARAMEPIPANSSADRFLPMDAASQRIEVALPAGDGFPADDVARLASVTGGANLVVGAGVPASVRRLASAYQAVRGAGSHRVLVTRDTSFAGAAVILAHTSESVGIVTSVPQSLLDGVRLPERSNVLIDAPSPGGWAVVAWAGEAPIVAVRESPVRQVWLALPFDDPAFAQSVDFAVLLTNAFDFVAGSREATMTASPATSTLSPGFAERDGVRIAVNQPFVDTTIVRADESWRDELARRVDAAREMRPFAGPLYVAAALLAAAAVFLR